MCADHLARPSRSRCARSVSPPGGWALIKWGLSDPRIYVSLVATAQPGRLAENAAAGSPPRFGPEEGAYVLRLVTGH